MKVGGRWKIEYCNEAIMNMISDVLPDPSGFPDTKITIFVSDNDDEVEWAVKFIQPRGEFARLVMGEDGYNREEEEKVNKILIVGDEIIPNGLYMLYSVLEEKVLRCKFNTKEEAEFYATVNSIAHFKPHKMTRSFSSFPWFDGTYTRPEMYGYSKVQLSDKE